LSRTNVDVVLTDIRMPPTMTDEDDVSKRVKATLLFLAETETSPG
jgi:hypothetical protein